MHKVFIRLATLTVLIWGRAALADTENETALDNEVGMPGGSTGKTFAAVLTMLLIEDGMLSVDDPAAKWLGDEGWFARIKKSDEILVRHLLSHSSGLDNYPGKVLRFLPGQGYAYTDVGYLVLGRVIEAATDQSYYDLLQERILDPHKLDQIRPQDHAALPNITPGYQGGVSNLKEDGRMKLGV